MRVLIADDHEVVRKSISSILQSRADIQICGEATNGEEAVSKTDQNHNPHTEFSQLPRSHTQLIVSTL